MSKNSLVGLSAVVLMSMGAALARAEDISAKKIFIKDNADPTKRQVQVQSKAPGVALSEADNPGASGASLHVYSASDDFCAILESGADVWTNTGTKWKFKDADKNTAQIANGKLKVKIKANVTYDLADDGSQGTVNAQVQFGTAGTRYCLRCPGNKKDDASKFLGKDCVMQPCDPEPSVCNPPGTTTTSTTTTSSTTTTTCPAPTPPSIKGALSPPTDGSFSYGLTPGLPGANAQCNTNFLCTHACTYSELQAAEAAGELVGLMDTASNPVTSFWAIDPTADPLLTQCHDDVNFPCPGGICPPGHTWEYGTAHTPSRGKRVPLNNGTGALGALVTNLQCNFSGTSWVGCCE